MGVTNVKNELNMVVVCLVFAAVVDVFSGNILQDDRMLKDPLQICNNLSHSPMFMDSLLIHPYFWCPMGVSLCSLKIPSKCSTTLRLPSCIGTRLVGFRVSNMVEVIDHCHGG